MSRRVVVLAVVLGSLVGLAPVAGARARWDTRLLALVQLPGFPAHPYVHPNGRIYEGTYTNLAGDQLSSRVFEYTRDGTLLRSWTVPGQDLSASHGVQVATSDAGGRLVLFDRTPARALLLDTRTGQLTTYATFADLPSCPGAQVQAGCTPTVTDNPPVPNYGAWGPDGSLYVSDYGQAVIWRVPPGGGTPAVWLADRRLDGVQFGTTGLALAADGHTLLIGQQSSLGLGAANALSGALYAVTIGANGKPTGMRGVWQSGPLDLPDGFAVARSGDIYVALLGPNQLVELGPDGRERDRFPAAALSGDNGSAAPFDSPSGVVYAGTSLIVANQSQPLGNPDHWSLLDVETGEAGLVERIPASAGPPAGAGLPKAGPKRPARHRSHPRRRHRRWRRNHRRF